MLLGGKDADLANIVVGQESRVNQVMTCGAASSDVPFFAFLCLLTKKPLMFSVQDGTKVCDVVVRKHIAGSTHGNTFRLLSVSYVPNSLKSLK